LVGIIRSQTQATQFSLVLYIYIYIYIYIHTHTLLYSVSTLTVPTVIPNTCFYILQGGQYILTLVDFYGANFTVFILGTIEVIGIAWIYGEFILHMAKLI
jgi:hypothetical protein